MMKTANETFELLSKLLSEKNSPETPYNELYEKIFLTVMQEVSEQLNKSSYPQKSVLISELKEVMDGVEILTQFPELIGKSIIGIMGTSGEVNDALLDKISMEQELKIYKYGNNVPVIIHTDNTENVVNAVNLIESPVAISPDDFRSANKELYKQRIDIRQFLFAFSVSAKIHYSNIAYINFPFYALKSQEYYINLINLVDTIILPVDEQGKWKYTLDYLKNFKQHKDIYIITNDENTTEVEKYIKELIPSYKKDNEEYSLGRYNDNAYSINIYALNNSDEWLEPYNCVRNNVAIAERILGIISRFNIYQIQRIEQLKNIISGMNRDLLNIDDEETVSSVRKLKIELDESLDNAKRNFTDFTAVTERLMDLVYQFEISLYNVASASMEELTDAKVLYHGQFEKNCSKLIMDLIQIGNFNLARQYISKLEARDYPYTYIFELYMDNKMKRTLSSKNLYELKNDNSKCNMVLKAKVKFGGFIDLSSMEIGEYAKSIDEPLDGYEYYVLGENYSRVNSSKAKIYYKKSLEQGYLDAGNKLVQYQDSKSYFELENLANMLVPEANYLYGIKCLENNKYARGITYLKIAAVFEHSKAIYKLADIEYSNACRKYVNPDERTEKSINIAFQLYQYLLNKNPHDTDVIEKLGQMYYWRKDYRKSRELLEKCTSAEALFTCGRMYQYGNGVAQDIYKARDLFKSASNKGHIRAKVEYEKVCGWISSNNVKNTYSKSRDYSTSSSYSHVSSSGGPCFLTTATCLALGKEDDCEELIAFKRYRDEHLIYDKDGANLIREYYRIAPFILQSIDKQMSPNMIFQKLYDEYIVVVYEYLKRKDYVNAKATYISMVENLCSMYGIEVISG